MNWLRQRLRNWLYADFDDAPYSHLRQMKVRVDDLERGSRAAFALRTAQQAVRTANDTSERFDALAAKLGVAFVTDGKEVSVVTAHGADPSLLRNAEEFVAAVRTLDAALTGSRDELSRAAIRVLQKTSAVRKVGRP